MRARTMLLMVTCLTAGRIHPQVLLNEVMFNPLGPEASDEFVEVFNTGKDSVDLTGWKIGDGTGEDMIIQAGNGTLLLPGQIGLILDPTYFGTSTTYDSLIPDTCLVLTLDGSTFGSSGLSNSQAETVTLTDASGQLVDSHTYNTNNLPGHSSERRFQTETPDPAAWGQSRTVNGTPGAPNSIRQWDVDAAVIAPLSLICDAASCLISVRVVNEGRESISEATVSFFRDADRNGRFDRDERIGTADLDNPLLSNDTVTAALPWNDAPSGRQAVGVTVDAEGDQVPENNGLSGEVMVPFAERSLVINEIMFQPFPGKSEWFELYNRSSQSLSLNGWSFSDFDTTNIISLADQETEIFPQGFAVIAEDSSIIDPLPPETPLLVPTSFPGLNNDFDTIILRDPTGRIIDRVAYEGVVIESQHVSLERVSPDRPSEDLSNWYRSTDVSGMTPGRVNSLFSEYRPAKSELSVTPNPFSPDGDGHEDAAMIAYRLPETISTLRIRIYDVMGRCIKTLRSGNLSGSEGVVIWDGLDDSGKPVQIGIYIVHLEALGKNRNALVETQTTLVVAGAL